MARELATIEQELDDHIDGVFDTPSVSQVAEWRLWRGIIASVIWGFENILDRTKALIENLIYLKQIGTVSWYHDQIKKFQGSGDDTSFQGDGLIVDGNGFLKYEQELPERRIVAHCALTETINGDLAVKVAKINGSGELERLSDTEKNALLIYINNIKIVGTSILLTSLAPDSIWYDMNVYYSPVYSEATIQANLAEKMEEFRNSLGFNDKIYKQHFIDILMQAEGVVSIKLNDFKGKPDADAEFANIDVVYQLAAGYYNYVAIDAETNPSVLTLINEQDL